MYVFRAKWTNFSRLSLRPDASPPIVAATPFSSIILPQPNSLYSLMFDILVCSSSIICSTNINERVFLGQALILECCLKKMMEFCNCKS